MAAFTSDDAMSEADLPVQLARLSGEVSNAIGGIARIEATTAHINNKLDDATARTALIEKQMVEIVKDQATTRRDLDNFVTACMAAKETLFNCVDRGKDADEAIRKQATLSNEKTQEFITSVQASYKTTKNILYGCSAFIIAVLLWFANTFYNNDKALARLQDAAASNKARLDTIEATIKMIGMGR
jgi:hypothetical protein